MKLNAPIMSTRCTHKFQSIIRISWAACCSYCFCSVKVIKINRFFFSFKFFVSMFFLVFEKFQIETNLWTWTIVSWAKKMAFTETTVCSSDTTRGFTSIPFYYIFTRFTRTILIENKCDFFRFRLRQLNRLHWFYCWAC